MKKAMLIGCGHFMSTGTACPGDWKCYKAANLGEGKFDEPAQVVGFVRCDCPGRTIIPNVMCSIKLSGVKPDVIMMSSCMATAKPECPTLNMDMMAKMIGEKTGIPVILGTHEY
jgi:predicted metal-binding protein